MATSIHEAAHYFSMIDSIYQKGLTDGDDICAIMENITSKIPVHDFNVNEKVNPKLE